MKIYTVEYDSNRPSLKQVNIPNYSNAKIGIEVISNNEKIELTKDNVKLTSGGTTLYADGEYNGYVTVPVSVGDCGNDMMYKVDINKETTLIDTDIRLVTPSDTPTGTVISVEYSLSDMVGQELNADSVQVIQRYNDNIEIINFLNIVDNNGRVIKAWQSPKTQGSPAPEPVWGDYRTTTGRVKSIKVEDGWKLFSSCAASTLSKGKTREIKIKQTSTFNNSFKLVINSVKSSVCEEEKELKTVMSETTYYKFEPETSADYLTYTSTSGSANLSCVIKGFTIDKTTNQINHLTLDTIGQQGSGQPTVNTYDANITRDINQFYIEADKVILGSIKYDRVNDTLKFSNESTPTEFSKSVADKDPVTKILSTENVDYNTANVIDESTNKIPNNKAVKDYVDNTISVASGNTPKVFQAFKGSETYLKNNSVDVTGVKVGDIILAGSAENAIKVMWRGPEFGQNTIYIDNIDTNNMKNGVYSGVVMSIFDTPQKTQIVVACGEKCVTFSGNKGE